jgi:hypothetical protein
LSLSVTFSAACTYACADAEFGEDMTIGLPSSEPVLMLISRGIYWEKITALIRDHSIFTDVT